MDQTVSDCPECQRLWKQYTDSVARLHDLQRQQNAASSTFDVPALRNLQPQVQKALKERSDGAEQLVRHQQRQHAEPRIKSASRKPN